MSVPDTDLVVLGAGPAGLAAAWRAARAGHAVTVLERGDDVGGLSASFEVAGVRVDHGSHRLHPATPPALLGDLRALLGGDLQTRPRDGRLRLGGRWVAFPLRAGELLRAIPPGTLARIGAEAAAYPLRRRSRHRADSFAAALRGGLGPTLYGQLYAPYAVKLWGLPGERISADQAAKRVTADTPARLAARLLRHRPGGVRTGPGQVFHYPRRGFGQIADALAGAAADAGAEIRTGTPVTALEHDRNGVVAVTVGGDTVRARHAFSTVPLPLLARIARPGPPGGVLGAAARLRFRAMVLVYLLHRGGRWTRYDAHYLPGAGTPVTRLSEPANYRDSAADPAGHSVVCAEIPCDVGDASWTAGEAALEVLVSAALVATGLPPLHGVAAVRRVPFVYPVYEIGYHRHLDGLDAWAGGLPRVTTFGRLGLFAHDNTHHALAMAYDAVAALRRDSSRDAATWSAARERFAGHVVED